MSLIFVKASASWIFPSTCSLVIVPVGTSACRDLIYSAVRFDRIVWPPLAICCSPLLESDSILAGTFPNYSLMIMSASSMSSDASLIAFTSPAVLDACFILSLALFHATKFDLFVRGQDWSASCYIHPLLPQ